MPNFEYKKPEVGDCGSFEMDERGRVVRNEEVTEKKFLKNEEEIKVSKAISDAKWDLMQSWWAELNMAEVFDSSTVVDLFQKPDDFTATLASLSQEMSKREFYSYISQLERTIRRKILLLQTKQEQAVAMRVDYVNASPQALDKELDKELKIKLEMLVEAIGYYIKNGEYVLDFITEQKARLSS